MKMISKAAADELREMVRSAKFADEMNSVSQSRHNPFIRSGDVDIDAYLAFVSQFNEFINHEPRKFVPMLDTYMRL
jgi:hypothetical protein